MPPHLAEDTPMTYSLLSYQSDRGPRAGMRIGDRVYDVEQVTGRPQWSTVMGMLDEWEEAGARCNTLARHLANDRGTAALDPGQVKLLAPLLYPGTLYCAGANYRDHVEEMAKARGMPPPPTMKDLGEVAGHFIKTSRSAVVGPGAIVPIPNATQRLDWELELAAVIGKRATNVKAADALDYVAGYTIANDLSARDRSRRAKLEPGSLMYYDWIAHKSFDGSCPMGPYFVPSPFISDPNALDMKLWVNGELMQDSNTSNQIFDIGEQIEALSHRVTLQPGDVVLTGTPAGVGSGRGQFLKAGDVVKLWIAEIGEFEHGIG
jgi:2-keto-4-pentenoate hydratase/2-oxohepta-3-ene-1,7-dioic acid hydratase in catechol pathway